MTMTRIPRQLPMILLAAALGCDDSITEPSVTRQTPASFSAAAAPLSFRQVTTGANHSCGLTFGNRVFCWGSNDDGELGDGTRTDRSRPVLVATSVRFIQLSAGRAHTCGVSSDNHVYCWGNNLEGTLGDGSSSNRLTPVLVRGGLLFRQVSAGDDHSCGATLDDKG